VSDLAGLEIALRQDCAYVRLADSHVHRATREDSLGLTKGRDALTAAWVAEGKQSVSIEADLGDMIAFQVDGAWHGHRWVWREEGRVLREVVVEDRGVAKVAPPAHPPLGELNAGRGQFAASETALLPPDFAKGAIPLANRLHRAWNGRAFDLYSADWLTRLIRTLPDAHFQFERALVSSDTVALLWRVMGHDTGGQRIRLIGSSVFVGEADRAILDWAAMDAQRGRAMIDYGAAE
jgi:hypothetical protein